MKFSVLYRRSAIVLLILLFILTEAHSQEEFKFKKTYINAGFGLGYHEGSSEWGIGVLGQMGAKIGLDQRRKLRLNPSLVFAGYTTIFSEDRYNYRLGNFNINVHYDLIRYRAFNLVITAGTGVSNSEGSYNRWFYDYDPLTGQDTYFDIDGSFNCWYIAGNISAALRLDIQSKPWALELRPMTYHFGNSGYRLYYTTLEFDFKIGR